MSDIREITAIGTEYDLELDETAIKIGGLTEKFVPNINASKWDDEAWLNINCPVIVNDEKETFADDKIELVVGDQTHRFYEIDGKLEYEIEFAHRPASNQIEFNLTFPEGLRFSYQDTLYNEWLAEQEANPGNPNNLTWEQYQEAAHRPENVVGSYAVYWNKRNNKYKTGKFCHIYRIGLKDADSKIVWADDMEIIPIDKTHARLVVTMPGRWLDDARYPVKSDPILGYHIEAGSNWGYNNIKDTIWDVTDGTGGVVNTYYCFLESVGSGDCKMGVYDCSQVNYDPVGADLIEQSLLEGVGVGENSAAGQGQTLSANTYYNIAWIPSDSGNDVYYDSDGNCGYYRTGMTYADQLSNPWEVGGATAHNRHYSLWVDYGGAAPSGMSTTIATANLNARRRILSSGSNTGLPIL